MSAQPRILQILNIVSIVLLVVAAWMVFFYAPLEVTMGAVQRVFYFHVATAWVGMLGFIFAAVIAAIYLKTKDMKWDIIGLAAVEISLVFFFITLVLGSIWARPIWNAWWTWEPRLTTAVILEMIYLAYLLLREGIEDPERRARFGAVYTLFGAISVPITFFSIRYLRTIHPIVVGGANDVATGTFHMESQMLQTMLFAILTFSVIFVTLFWHRIRLGQFAEKIEQLKLQSAA
jgi:heme exporter protein C